MEMERKKRESGTAMFNRKYAVPMIRGRVEST